MSGRRGQTRKNAQQGSVNIPKQVASGSFFPILLCVFSVPLLFVPTSVARRFDVFMEG
jgi:hypothetical protein